MAGVTVGASVAGAVWLYTYRTHDLIRFIDRNGVEFHDPRRVSVQPWWGTYLALILLAVAAAAAIRLLPDGLPTVRRLRRFFSSATEKRRSGHAHP